MNFIAFIFSRHFLQSAFAIAIFVGLPILLSVKPDWFPQIQWLDALIGVGTLAFAFLLWLNGLKSEWENHLPKRLTTEFRFQGRDIMICKDALLHSEADARAWGQQLGAQMANCQRLRFHPFFRFEPAQIRKSNATGRFYKSYRIVFFLTELPTPEVGSEAEKKQLRLQLEKGCIEWIPSEKENGEIVPEIKFTKANSVVVSV